MLSSLGRFPTQPCPALTAGSQDAALGAVAAESNPQLLLRPRVGAPAAIKSFSDTHCLHPEVFCCLHCLLHIRASFIQQIHNRSSLFP